VHRADLAQRLDLVARQAALPECRLVRDAEEIGQRLAASMLDPRPDAARGAPAEICCPVTARARNAATPRSARSGNQIGAAAIWARRSGEIAPAVRINRR